MNKRNFLKVVEIPLPQYQKNGRKIKINEVNGSNEGNNDCSKSENSGLRQKEEEKRNRGIETAQKYLQIMESEGIETRADLARRLNVSRARVTQVLRRLQTISC